MPFSAVLGATPYFVLVCGKRHMGPSVVPLPTGTECPPIYGFSKKDAYDRFCLNSHLALTPYPLVRRHLRNQTSAPDDGLKLVVVDAAGPREPYLQAATVESVLEAHENRMSHVTVAYRLVFNQQAEAYRVEEVSV